MNDHNSTVLNSSSFEIDVLRWKVNKKVIQDENRCNSFVRYGKVMSRESIKIAVIVCKHFWEIFAISDRWINYKSRWSICHVIEILTFSAVILLTTYASSSPAPASSSTPAPKNTCAKACTADYAPICGKPAEGKGTNITFGNKCVLDNYNCEKKDKRKIY